jgi:DNA polymerase III subunit chi
MECWFYHLERASVEAALPTLVEKCLQRGWPVRVASPVPERLEALDGLLWSWRDDSWLPHGLAAGGPDDARQPVLLGPEETGNVNGARALFRLDGAGAGDLSGIERTFVLFDGRSEEAVARAREDFRAARSEGHDMAYWKQDGDGPWTRQA